MKIGIVLSSVPGYSETFFHSKINGLSKSGFKIILFAPGKPSPDLHCKIVAPFPVYNSILFRVFSAGIILPIIFLRNPDHFLRFCKCEKQSGSSASEIIRRLYINAHLLTRKLDWVYFGFATVAIGREHVAKAIGARMAVSFRGYDINVYPLKHPGCYKQVWEQVDKVHSISRYLYEKAIMLGLSLHTNFQIISPAVEIRQAKDQVEFHDPIQIVSVGRLHWIKGFEYAIQAIAELNSKGINVQYTIIGEGSEYEKLKFEIIDLGVHGNVTLAGKLSHDETIKKVRTCDIYIQPSLNEGFCNAVLEAQALGCLCIVSDTGALPENVIDNVTGWLVSARRPDRLAKAIHDVILLSAAKRKVITEQARKRVAEEFSIEHHLTAWKSFYQ